MTMANGRRPQFADIIMTLTDSYKHSHAQQYPDGTEKIVSYMESRGGLYDETLFFGLQYFMKEYLEGRIVTKDKIDEAEIIVSAHFGDPDIFQRKRWEYIMDKHDGHLPLRIRAVAEGTVVPTHNALVTIENTDPECFWLTNFVETLLMQEWSPITVASYSRMLRILIANYLRKTGDPSLLPFKLHDFGFRGVSSVETAATAGAAHLVNFMGTDTMAALMLLREFYHCDMAGFTIPAAEHSTITSWLKQHEREAYYNMITKFPHGLVAIVSDSYDIRNACDTILGMELHSSIMKRDGTVVVRPDSGDPPVVVLDCLEILGRRFGYTENNKGFKVLDPHVRLIQGDGVDYKMVDNILNRMRTFRWSADNIAFGSGGALLQKHNRDTFKMALKCSFAIVNGEGRDVYKSPVTDPGKFSKRGILHLVKEDGVFQTISDDIWNREQRQDHLDEVYLDGKVLVDHTLDDIRKRAIPEELVVA